MAKKMPASVKRVCFDFNWSNKKVWELNVKTEKMPISKLEWHFYLPFFKAYTLKAIDVIERPGLHRKEYQRTMRANLRHPIDIMRNKGRWLILDGLHRLAKAKIRGMTEVNVRKIPRSMIARIEP